MIVKKITDRNTRRKIRRGDVMFSASNSCRGKGKNAGGQSAAEKNSLRALSEASDVPGDDDDVLACKY